MKAPDVLESLKAENLLIFLDAQASLAPTPVSPLVRRSIRLSYFHSVSVDMVADMGADMEVDMVTNMSADNKKKWANMELADTEVDKVADMVADNKKKRH